MTTPVSFSVFNSSGIPTNSVTPVFVAGRDSLGNPIGAPTINNLGSNGSYSFLYPDGGYLIYTGALPTYVQGGVGDGVFFALFDQADAVKADATPTVSLTEWSGAPLASPGVSVLGGGLYWFPTPGPCVYLVTTGCNPEYLTGSIDYVAPDVVVAPTATSSSSAVGLVGRDIYIDFATGKFFQSKGDLVLVTGTNAVMQAVLIALNTFIGTYWLDTGYGIDYWNGVLGKNRPRELILATFRNALLAVEGVIAVPSIEYSLSNARVCRVTAKIKSNDGVFNVSTSVGV